MKEWLENLDTKTAVKIMLGHYIHEQIIKAINNVSRVYRGANDYNFEFFVELNNKLPQNTDKKIKETLLNSGFDKYINVDIFLSNSCIKVVVNYKKSLNKNDFDNIYGLFMLLGYADKV